MSKQYYGVVKLAPHVAAWYDSINEIYLTWGKRWFKCVTDDMDLRPIMKGIQAGLILWDSVANIGTGPEDGAKLPEVTFVCKCDLPKAFGVLEEGVLAPYDPSYDIIPKNNDNAEDEGEGGDNEENGNESGGGNTGGGNEGNEGGGAEEGGDADADARFIFFGGDTETVACANGLEVQALEDKEKVGVAEITIIAEAGSQRITVAIPQDIKINAIQYLEQGYADYTDMFNETIVEVNDGEEAIQYSVMTYLFAVPCSAKMTFKVIFEN